VRSHAENNPFLKLDFRATTIFENVDICANLIYKRCHARKVTFM